MRLFYRYRGKQARNFLETFCPKKETFWKLFYDIIKTSREGIYDEICDKTRYTK